MRHPIEKYNQIQAEQLASLPEEHREFTARLFRIGNASYRYYNRANDLPPFAEGLSEPPEDLLQWLEQMMDPTPENSSARELLAVYFEEYLDGLPHEGMRRVEKERGLDEARQSIPFRRYVLERHDIGMNEFLRQHLSEEDFNFHIDCGKP